MFARIAGSVMGERSSGVQEHEKMLTLGTWLLGIGRLSSKAGVISLEPPQDGSPYILTSQSKNELIDSYRSQATALKYLCIVCGVLGGGFLVYKLVGRVMRWWEHARAQQMFEQVRARLRSRRRPTSDAAGDANDTETVANSDTVQNVQVGQGEGDPDAYANERECIVCLVNERNVVLLECGHICVCVDCAEILPIPRKCPMCRSRVTRVVSLYQA